MKTAQGSQRQTRRYHILSHASSWWVEDDAGASLFASMDQEESVRWAIRSAQHDHARGRDVIVCVEQSDGSWKTAWHA